VRLAQLEENVQILQEEVVNLRNQLNEKNEREVA
jgi:uncharacterized small protein (DUF1192 family)